MLTSQLLKLFTIVLCIPDGEDDETTCSELEADAEEPVKQTT